MQYEVKSVIVISKPFADPNDPKLVIEYPVVTVPDNAVGITLVEMPVNIMPKIATPNPKAANALACRISYLVPANFDIDGNLIKKVV